MDFSEFHFLRPLWLLGIVPLVILLWRLARRHDKAGVWQSICDDALLPYLLVNRTVRRRPVNLGLFALAGLTAIIALAGPTWERLPAPVFRDESALVVVLDMSRSMDAGDVSPSRLERAKFKITDVLRARRDGQTALIVYTGEPYVVTPLTNDIATIENQLPALKTSIMPSRGSAAAAALEKSVDLLAQAGMTGGEILLVTDGMPLAERDRALKIARRIGPRLSVLGVGTEEGAPIPDQRGGFVQDERGNIVIEPLRPELLSGLASAGRGLYQTVRTDDRDVDSFTANMEQERNDRNAATTDLFTDRWKEIAPWLLLGILPFAPLAFRRGILSVSLVVLLPLGNPSPAAAGWWQTDDQAGQEAFAAGDFEDAANTFADPHWRASAQYRAGDYAAAAESLGEDPNPQAQYNRGNALARQGKLEEAIAAYDEALAAVPEHEDAAHNKALLEKLLEEQQKQNQDQQSESSDDTEQTGESGQGGGEPSDRPAGNEQSESQSDESTPPDESEQQQDSNAAAENEQGEDPAEQEQAEEQQSEQQSDDSQEAAAPGEQAQAQANSDMENDQATEQWLRQIPDDPGGLLRRKFEHEYQRNRARAMQR